MALKQRNPGCNCCPEICDACGSVNGAGDDFNIGLEFSISGLANKAGSLCNCPDFDGTYRVPRVHHTLEDGRIVPNVASCVGEKVFADTCCDAGGGEYQWLMLRWNVWEYIPGTSLGVGLYIYLLQSDTCPDDPDDADEIMWLPYHAYAITTSCAAWSSLSMSWTSGAGGYSDAAGCDNEDALTIDVSSY